MASRGNLSMCRWTICLAVCAFTTIAPGDCRAQSVRIKDITDVEGVRENVLTGMGLIVGLNGTGGRNPETREVAQNLLQRFGLRFDETVRARLRNDSRFRTDNMSVVIVTADLPTTRSPGQRIDVTVSAFDDATSLEGGILIQTPLVGVDGQVYAVASGPFSNNGFSAGGRAASVQKNHPTSGRIPNGATVELSTSSPPHCNGVIRFHLRDPDFETAQRISDAINEELPGAAHAIDLGTVVVLVPKEYQEMEPHLIAAIERLEVHPDTQARVVINERTGTIVIGENVRVSRVLITHANLSVITGEFPQVSQPAPFSDGETVVVPRTELEVMEEANPVQVVDPPATVGDLARTLNALGATPRDLSAIFQQLKEVGALHAELLLK